MRPIGMRSVRWVPGIAALVALAGCVWPLRTPAPPPGQTIGATITNANLNTSTADGVSLPLGDLVLVSLISTSYRPSGSVAPWTVSVASPSKPTTPTVLVPSSPPPGATCPPQATCSYFRGAARGKAALAIGGPSGILCNRQHQDCVGVSAISEQVTVEVK